MKERQGALLEPYRVLDLTDEKGLNCGRNFGDMGAEVIKIEKPGGDRARSIGPSYHDTPDPEQSLFWLFMCMNKKSITLNLETIEGREVFKQLVKTADFVLESFDPGYMLSLGLGYEDLEKINPAIIVVSITLFGQDGPYKDYAASDMVAWAMSGFMYLAGDLDRAPVQVSYPQAFLHAATTASAGALAALFHRHASGQGQMVDVSVQEVCSWIATDAHLYSELLNEEIVRAGSGRTSPFPKGEVRFRYVYPCKDGYVFYLAPGINVLLAAARAWNQWLAEAGIGTGHMEHFGWPAKLDFTQMSPQDVDTMQDTLGSLMIRYTKAELYQNALKRNIPLVPVAAPGELFENDQLEDRDFWIDLEHPELDGPITCPGPWARTTPAPLTGWRPAPRIGEHNEEIYIRELGLTAARMIVLKQAGVI